MASANSPKDTIYIDVDDEITGIIDKLRSSDGKIVALVLPKRASVFQSIVNMKLLKRAADDAKKHLVLITTETGLLPLAGLAGVLVAASLTSKPAIPIAPSIIDDQEETVDEATGEAEASPVLDISRPVGELAGLSAVAVAADGVETIDMTDMADEAEAGDLPDTKDFAPASPKKLKKDQKLHVPNFERFRLLLVLGGLIVIALIVGGIFAFMVLPKATISITTDASNINTNINLTADSTVNAYNPANHTLPAKLVTQSKTYNEQAAATGQKNNGDKASGQVDITNCGQDDITVPAGTGVSSGSYTFITQNSVVVPASSTITKHNVSSCLGDGHNIVNVKAQAGGSGYNLADKSKYSVSGQNSNTVTGVGSAMTGGTDNIVKIISQSDIDSAKAKISASDDGIKTALNAQLVQAGLYGLAVTFNTGAPTVTSSATVGDAADNVTVTEVVGYSMLGVQQTDLKNLIDESVKKQIDISKQSILDEGLRAATFTQNSAGATSAQLTLQTVAVAGPQLNVDTIKKLAAGKKSGDIQTALRSDPGVTDVVIKLSPFFVSTVPKKLDKITVTIAKPAVKPNTTSNGSNP
jgi:hypothetical protein